MADRAKSSAITAHAHKISTAKTRSQQTQFIEIVFPVTIWERSGGEPLFINRNIALDMSGLFRIQARRHPHRKIFDISHIFYPHGLWNPRISDISLSLTSRPDITVRDLMACFVRWAQTVSELECGEGICYYDMFVLAEYLDSPRLADASVMMLSSKANWQRNASLAEKEFQYRFMSLKPLQDIAAFSDYVFNTDELREPPPLSQEFCRRYRLRINFLIDCLAWQNLHGDGRGFSELLERHGEFCIPFDSLDRVFVRWAFVEKCPWDPENIGNYCSKKILYGDAAEEAADEDMKK